MSNEPPDSNDKQNKIWSNWLKNALSSLLGKKERGDVIVGTVGAGARNIAIGKNIIQVGSLKVPTLPVVASLLVMALAATLALWLLLVPSQMPVNSFNVAVAEFGQVDADGRMIRSEDGRNLSQWMFTELQKEYKTFPADTDPPVVWHDSMGPTRKRARIGLIRGDTPEARAEAAAALARRIKADMVIYGNLFEDEGQIGFAPEFYIAEIENEADEMVGPYQLGAPIALRSPIDPHDEKTSLYLRNQLGSRTDLLTWFTRGLVYDLAGYHQDAFDVFQQAETELQSWDDSQGQEIHYYFKGREALFLSRDDEAWLPIAEEAFRQALSLNADYARAHIGLGGVYYQRAQYLPPDLRLETRDLDRAIAEYEQAVEKGANSLGTQVPLKGRLGLGFAYRLQGEAYLHRGEYEQAIAAFDQASAYLEAALPLIGDDQHRLLAQSYLALGATYHQKAHVLYVQGRLEESGPIYEKARAAYTECITQADEDFYDKDLRDLKANRCLPFRDDVQQVLDSLAGGS